MATKKKKPEPIQEAVEKVVEKVKKSRKTTKADEPVKNDKKTTKKPAPKPAEKPESKPADGEKKLFVKGGKGGPGRPRLISYQAETVARGRQFFAKITMPKLEEAVEQGQRWAIQQHCELFGPKIKAISEDPELLSAKGRELLQEYLDGKRGIKETAIMLEMSGIQLPDSVKLLLAKEQPEPEDPTNGQYSVWSDEEMEQRRAARKEARRKQQEEWLPERQAEARELRKGMEGKDAFAPNAVPTAKEEG